MGPEIGECAKGSRTRWDGGGLGAGETKHTVHIGNIVLALHGTCFELPPAWDGMENVQTLFKRHHKYIKNG